MGPEQASTRSGEHVIVMKSGVSSSLRRTSSWNGGRTQYEQPLIARARREIIVVQCWTAGSPFGTARTAWPAGPLGLSCRRS